MLANDNLSLDIDPATGALCSIRDERFDTEYIQVPSFARLFRLIVPLENWRAHHIDSWRQPAPRIAGDDRRLTITYEELRSKVDVFPIRVTVELTLAAGSDEVRAQIRIANHSER